MKDNHDLDMTRDQMLRVANAYLNMFEEYVEDLSAGGAEFSCWNAEASDLEEVWSKFKESLKNYEEIWESNDLEDKIQSQHRDYLRLFKKHTENLESGIDFISKDDIIRLDDLWNNIKENLDIYEDR